MPRLKFTAELVKNLPAPAPAPSGATRQTIYHDSEQAGLALRVTSGGSRVYVVEGSIAGESVRVRLGATSDLTLSQARQRAQGVRGDIAKGVNPNAEKKRRHALSVTLAEAFEAFIQTRKAARRLAPRTEYDYRRILYGATDRDGKRLFNGYLSPWRALPIAVVTPELVARKHAELVERSGAWANHAMRMLSTVCNFASATYRVAGAPLFAENPVRILSQTKAWYRVPQRSSLIRAHELAAWWKAVLEVRTDAQFDLADVTRDFLQFVVLTGLRRGEASRLKWADVDFKARTFTVRRTKNGSDHTLPMSDYVEQLLAGRRRDQGAEYVFQGANGRGALVEPKKLIAKVREASGVHFTIHDLRRTFATVADSLDLPGYAIKRLLNHRMANDVTAGYIVADVERLRAPMQKVTDFMLRAAGLRETAPIVELTTKREVVNG